MSDQTKQGQLIVFEGCDDVGKTTIVEELAKQLLKNGKNCRVLSFPGRTPGTVGQLVYDIHHSKEADGLNEAAKQILHIAAHVDCIENQIKPLLANGEMVILDRYWWSTWVYGLVGGVQAEHLKKMIDLEKEFWDQRNPDCLIMLRRQDAENSKLVTQRVVEYARLSGLENEKYPVREIHNNMSVESTISEVLSCLKALTIIS